MIFRTAALAGAGLAGYAAYEARAYRVTEQRVPVRPGAPALSLLHVSDTHIGPHNRGLAGWLKHLPEIMPDTPDLVIATGDFIDDDSGIDPFLEAMHDLPARLGRFYVLGSHDFFQSTLQGFVGAFRKLYSGTRAPVTVRPADTARLEAGLKEAGWISLANTTEVLEAEPGPVRLIGLDDPFLGRHTTEHIRRLPEDALAVGVVHTPDVVSEWALAGFDLVLAGHTHGGQVRFPVVGAAVTNCALPTGLARGLHRVGSMWLHVSPGLGTSKFTPGRFLCAPEATLLRISPERL